MVTQLPVQTRCNQDPIYLEEPSIYLFQILPQGQHKILFQPLTDYEPELYLLQEEAELLLAKCSILVSISSPNIRFISDDTPLYHITQLYQNQPIIYFHHDLIKNQRVQHRDVRNQVNVIAIMKAQFELKGVILHQKVEVKMNEQFFLSLWMLIAK
ncbi:Hypothetical_protein [Hexamita inflata]|uniref:Hypothetical_protein n=1 Tax=Hexamita inflata TaxID=28002 RepID=A0AA86TYR5_9EUKA|nr:Hypothetical protein HINF_LOCUS19817 [Hexamita inflata]